ncbi:SAM-dependent methyltransferase [Gloeothece citriformis]|uniref:SAM-dependent methyltransferase n=1 Tax=Gloeothece citriformis TaxID=2546356 RepID=UPI000173B735|nr:SAM-dependent methyltransferase [Gloeothece citriformis]
MKHFPFDYFPTPTWVSSFLVKQVNIKPSDVIIESSAGTGELINSIKQAGGKNILSFEIVPQFQVTLAQQGILVVSDNFLTYPNLSSSANVIIQNPPFSLQLSFIYKAYQCLKKDGQLVSLMSNTPWRFNRPSYQRFKGWCERVNAKVVELPYGLFLNSTRPTSVNCYCLKIIK